MQRSSCVGGWPGVVNLKIYKNHQESLPACTGLQYLRAVQLTTRDSWLFPKTGTFAGVFHHSAGIVAVANMCVLLKDWMRRARGSKPCMRCWVSVVMFGHPAMQMPDDSGGVGRWEDYRIVSCWFGWKIHLDAFTSWDLRMFVGPLRHAPLLPSGNRSLDAPFLDQIREHCLLLSNPYHEGWWEKSGLNQTVYCMELLETPGCSCIFADVAWLFSKHHLFNLIQAYTRPTSYSYR